MNRNLLESVREMANQVAQETGVTVYDVEFSGSSLRVFIESEPGITIDVCQRFSELMARALDQSNLILARYFLEVSSPGLERRLRSLDDFRRAIGRFAHVVAAQGAWDGTILRVTEHAVVLEVPTRDGLNREQEIDFGDIRRANLKVTDHELFARRPAKPVEKIVEEQR